ncbi:MAG: DAK2 domain-containing protein [Oscillospiraceae bacterium]
MIQTIDAPLFKSMIASGAALLEQNKQQINELNVFPVPDGDTGTNMSLTLNSGVTALNTGITDTVGACCDIVASALLRGARGNSGVILSLLFRGMSKALRDKDSIGTFEFAEALAEGVAVAYKAVMRPTEGTILTVSRLVADAATQEAETLDDFEAMMEKLLAVGDEALADTINQNPVLKKAGVIDAGGKGYLYILRGMLAAIEGNPVERSEDDPQAHHDKADFASLTDEDITFTFDTVFIVRKTTNKSLKPLQSYLNSIGDSLVIGEDDTAFKVHVHTDMPGAALAEAQKYGTLELAKVENMRLQYEDMAAGRKTHSADELDNDDEDHSTHVYAAPEKKYGVVAVCAGEGMQDVFKNLGVDALVTGGQTMNPSTEDILRAVQSVPAETVFVLPNNKNIIMAAQQCDNLTDKNVVVIPSKTVPQGISALVCFDDSLNAEELADVMTDACSTVHTALVTYAARDSEFDGTPIHAGEYLALLENTLLASTSDLSQLIARVSEAIREFDPEVLTVFYGEDVNESAAIAVEEKLSSDFPDADTTLINGGQPVYYYMISAE